MKNKTQLNRNNKNFQINNKINKNNLKIINYKKLIWMKFLKFL